MHFRFEQLLSVHFLKQAKNKGFTFLERISRSPAQNNDVRFIQGRLNCRVIPCTNIIRQSLEVVGLNASELIDNNQSLHLFKFSKISLKDNLLHKLD